MNRFLILIASALLLQGCVTKSRVYEWLDKNRIDAARYCSVEFPITERVVRGETIVIRDTVTHVDSVDCSPDSSGVINRVPCPPSKIIYEVSHRTDSVVTIDYAALAAVRLEMFEEKAGREVAEYRAGVAERQAKSRLIWIIGISVLAVIIAVMWFRGLFRVRIP